MIINFCALIILELSQIVIISHLFNISEVMLKMRRHPTNALTSQPGQTFKNLPWKQSQQYLLILSFTLKVLYPRLASVES